MERSDSHPDGYDTEHIRDVLAKDPRVNELDVHVTVAGRKVFLTGNVATPERRDAVGQVVHELFPQVDIHNDVSVNAYTEPSGQEVVS